MARICSLAERKARARLRDCFSSIPHSGSTGEHGDSEVIHDLRVGCRRARVTLSEFGDQFAPGPRREAREALREIRKRLGKLRELDVSLALLEDFCEGHPHAVQFARNRLQELRREAESAAQPLDSPLGEAGLNGRIATLEGAYRSTTQCYRKHAERRLTKRLKKLVRQHKAWKLTQRPDDLHDLRVRFKKMRYTLEVYVDLYGKPGKDLLYSLEEAQDTLGGWNDHRVLNEYLARMRSDADDATQAALNGLSGDVGERMERFLTDFGIQAKQFFEKGRLRSVKELFGKPNRPCCDKS